MRCGSGLIHFTDILQKIIQIGLKKLFDLITSEFRMMYLYECHFYQLGPRYRLWVPPEKHGPMILDNAKYHHANLPGEHMERNYHIMLEFLSIIFFRAESHRKSVEVCQVKGYSQQILSFYWRSDMSSQAAF